MTRQALPVRPTEKLASTGGRSYGSTHQCLSIRNPGPLVRCGDHYDRQPVKRSSEWVSVAKAVAYRPVRRLTCLSIGGGLHWLGILILSSKITRSQLGVVHGGWRHYYDINVRQTLNSMYMHKILHKYPGSRLIRWLAYCDFLDIIWAFTSLPVFVFYLQHNSLKLNKIRNLNKINITIKGALALFVLVSGCVC